jgi:sugar phosphate isomerase/epimerase
MTRRQLLWSLAAIRPLYPATSLPAVGCDLGSIRALLKHDPDKVLHDLAAMGFHEVEGYSRVDTIALAPKLKQNGLTVRSCHTETPLVTADWESYPDFKKVALNEAMDSLKAIGAEYFIVGEISIGARGDGDDFYRRTADRMNEVAKSCRKSGLKFLWQPQGFEFQGKPGLRAIDIFHDRLDSSLVQMEVDVFRISLMGLDPVETLRQWKGRVAIVRLMDKTKGTRPHLDDAVEQGAYQNLGAGVIDIRGVLKSGVKIFSVGQAVPEEDATDPLAGLRGNLQYLGKLLK